MINERGTWYSPAFQNLCISVTNTLFKYSGYTYFFFCKCLTSPYFNHPIPKIYIHFYWRSIRSLKRIHPIPRTHLFLRRGIHSHTQDTGWFFGRGASGSETSKSKWIRSAYSKPRWPGVFLFVCCCFFFFFFFFFFETSMNLLTVDNWI